MVILEYAMIQLDFISNKQEKPDFYTKCNHPLIFEFQETASVQSDHLHYSFRSILTVLNLVRTCFNKILHIIIIYM